MHELLTTVTDRRWAVVVSVVGLLCVLPLGAVLARTIRIAPRWFLDLDDGDPAVCDELERDRKEWRRLIGVGVASATGLTLTIVAWTWTSITERGYEQARGYRAAMAVTDVSIMLGLTFWLLSYWRDRTKPVRSVAPDIQADPDGPPQSASEEGPVGRPFVVLIWMFRIVAVAMSSLVILSFVGGVNLHRDSRQILVALVALVGIGARAIEAIWADHAERGHWGRLFGWMGARLYLLPTANALLVIFGLMTFGVFGLHDVQITAWWVDVLLIDLALTYGLLEVSLPLGLMHRLHEWRLRIHISRRHPIAWVKATVPKVARTVEARRRTVQR